MSRIPACVLLFLAAPAAAEPAEPAAPPVIAIGGYLDTYYMYSLGRPADGVTALRLESVHGGFTVAAAAIEATATAERWHARVVVQAGADAAAVSVVEPVPSTWQPLREASAGVSLGGDVTVDAGLMLSPIGPESLVSKDDWNWSRSTAFVALPTYHVGVRATRPLGGGVTAQAWLVNGWNAATDGNRGKTALIGATRVDGGTTIALLYAGGVEATGTDAPWRHLLDGYAIVAVTDRVDVMAHVDGGIEGERRWLTGALYARARATDTVEVAARVDGLREWSDAPSLLGVERVVAATATASWRAAAQVLLRAELRHDRAGDPVFPDGDALGRTQTTATTALTAWF